MLVCKLAFLEEILNHCLVVDKGKQRLRLV